ncbi:hypothetical protein JCM6882_003689 [Rhodosporidiobolus microsporus]
MLQRSQTNSRALLLPLRTARTPAPSPSPFFASSLSAASSPSRHASSTSSAAAASSFARPSGPGLPRRIVREQPERDLPELKSRTPLYLTLALASALAWAGFLSYATNNERANSSVVRSLSFQLRSWPVVKEFLGDNVKIEPVFGSLIRVKGSINMLAGRIDVQFPVRGSKAGGTASFTSIRRGKAGSFEVLRWKITREDGAVLDLTGLDLTRPLDQLDGPAVQ